VGEAQVISWLTDGVKELSQFELTTVIVIKSSAVS
jgi:hypothetical protein